MTRGVGARGSSVPARYRGRDWGAIGGAERRWSLAWELRTPVGRGLVPKSIPVVITFTDTSPGAATYEIIVAFKRRQ